MTPGRGGAKKSLTSAFSRELAWQAFVALGLPEPVPVAEQVEPDPDFPTVAFPNPEEVSTHTPVAADGPEQALRRWACTT